MIRVAGVSVSLGGRPILRGIDLEAAAGSWTCLIGPNGSGKTTLLRAVAGLVPFSGRILLGGEEVGMLPRRRLARMLAMVPQNRVVPEGMSVGEYILLGRTPYIPYLGTESSADVEAVSEVLPQVRLEGLAGRAMSTLSGGELQRAVLARALAQDPDILLLDEPTAGLDLGYQQQVLELVDLLRAERRLTVLSAIHDLTLAAQFAERLVLLDAGEICATGPPAEVVTEARVLEHYGARVRVEDDRLGRPAVTPVRGNDVPDANRAAAERRISP